jgi:hypothetical protein
MALMRPVATNLGRSGQTDGRSPPAISQHHSLVAALCNTSDENSRAAKIKAKVRRWETGFLIFSEP